MDRRIKVNSQPAPSQDTRVQGPSLLWHQAGHCEGQFDDGVKQWSAESSIFPYQVSLQPCVSRIRKVPSEWLPDCSVLSFLCLLWLSGLLMMEAWTESLHFPSEFFMLFHRRENSSWIQPKSEPESSGNSYRAREDMCRCWKLWEMFMWGHWERRCHQTEPSWVLQTSRSCSLIFCRSYVSTGKLWIAIFWNILCGMGGNTHLFQKVIQRLSHSLPFWATLPDHLTEERWFSTLGCKQ